MPAGAAPGERRGGRPKGAINKDKRALLERIQAVCPGYDPVIAMAKIATDESQDISLRMTAHKEIAQYVTPKLKAVEHSGNVDGRLTVTVVRFSGTEADDAPGS